jgi:hypothetical protein
MKKSMDLVACAVAIAIAGPAAARHVAREDPSEPIFTERAFIERNVELDVGGVFGGDANELDLTLGATWTWADRFQLGIEIPGAVRFPEHAPTEAAFGDVGVSGQLVLCCDEASGFTFVSVRAELAAPTGDRAKAIGGTGGFGFALLGAYGLTVVEAWEDLGIQVELAYEQEIRPSDEEREAASARGRGVGTEKSLLWNVAVTQPFFGRRVTPVFEMLGTTTLDSVVPGEQGSGVELGVGVWLAPFDRGPLSPASFAAGYRFPVTQHSGDDGTALLIFEWSFD